MLLGIAHIKSSEVHNISIIYPLILEIETFYEIDMSIGIITAQTSHYLNNQSISVKQARG